MLIEFSIANFASFREKQTLSMVAAPQLRKRENTIDVELPKEKFPRLLKVLAIYGPNASGKSNILKAFECLQKIIAPPSGLRTGPLPVDPFRFDKTLSTKPSEFEIHFIHNKCRYSYELHATKDNITFERLTSYPFGEESILYTRTRSSQGEDYEWGKNLEGNQALHDVWRLSTNSKTCLITQAVANSNDELTQLRVPFAWLSQSNLVIMGDLTGMAHLSQAFLKKNQQYKESLVSLLDDVDVPISKITVRDKKEFDDHDKSALTTLLTHRTALGEAEFELEEESRGTQSLVGFMLPWFVFKSGEEVKNVFGSVLIVDELDASLHPNIVTEIIKRHIDNKEQTNQIIFTSHNTNLMDRKILRRDQFWLTERDENGATQLRSVHDFKGRDDEDMEKRYFEGKYRGLPHIARS